MQNSRPWMSGGSRGHSAPARSFTAAGRRSPAVSGRTAAAMTIRLLDPVTIGQIAAGEVIERPASVVKELVENALDAGATRISVARPERRARRDRRRRRRRRHPGRRAPAGAAAACDEQARRRVGPRFDRDLGFRGEGLASIAAVARTTIRSRTLDAEVATAVDAFGEAVGEPYPAPGPLGTRVTVRDLFASVPARREYLRTPGAEFTRIAQWLGTMALAYPRVGFTLEHDGRPSFAFAPDGDPGPRLAHVFGRGAGAMLPIRAASGDGRIVVGGWISPPGDDRPDRRGQIPFVNGRLLRSALLSGAWTAAYRTFAMTGAIRTACCSWTSRPTRSTRTSTRPRPTSGCASESGSTRWSARR